MKKGCFIETNNAASRRLALLTGNVTIAAAEAFSSRGGPIIMKNGRNYVSQR